MKKATGSSLLLPFLMVSGLLILNFSANSQESSGKSSALPDNINKIVTASCMPCHSSKGSLLPRFKLNFTKWSEYSAETQKTKASKMYAMLAKGAMPPKSARESYPERIPTNEQINMIKIWSGSLETGTKQ